MDGASNLVGPVCLACHAPLTEFSFFPDAGRDKLYKQLQRFKEFVSTLSGKRRANAWKVVPGHVHQINGDALCEEVREKMKEADRE